MSSCIFPDLTIGKAETQAIKLEPPQPIDVVIRLRIKKSRDDVAAVIEFFAANDAPNIDGLIERAVWLLTEPETALLSEGEYYIEADYINGNEFPIFGPQLFTARKGL